MPAFSECLAHNSIIPSEHSGLWPPGLPQLERTLDGLSLGLPAPHFPCERGSPQFPLCVELAIKPQRSWEEPLICVSTKPLR